MPVAARPWIGAPVGAEAADVAAVLVGTTTGVDELGMIASLVVGAADDGGGVSTLVVEVEAGVGAVEVMRAAEVSTGRLEETGAGRTLVASLVLVTEDEARVGAARARVVVVSGLVGVVQTVATTKSVIVTMSQSVTTTISRLLSGAAYPRLVKIDRRVTTLRWCILRCFFREISGQWIRRLFCKECSCK